MSDIEFIKFLVTLLWNEVTDGDTPSSDDFIIIENELKSRGIEDMMGY